jgi:hypothetical protein
MPPGIPFTYSRRGWGRRRKMKKYGSTINRVLFILLFLCAAGVSLMGYNQFMGTRTAKNPDMTTWLHEREIVYLMRFHGTEALKITQDEVYIRRNGNWIQVMKRSQG